MSNVIEQEVEKVREALKGRKCVICAKENLTIGELRRSNTQLELPIHCTCGALYWMFGFDNKFDLNGRLRLFLAKNILPNWSRCEYCLLPYTHSELKDPNDNRCPVCRIFSLGELDTYIDDRNTVPCPDCTNLLELFKLRKWDEYRDGMMGDYTRTTEDVIGCCPECMNWFYLKLEENNKFGPVCYLRYCHKIPEHFLARLARAWDLENWTE